MPARDPSTDVRVENEMFRRHQDVLIALARRAAERVSLDDFIEELAVRVAEAIEIDHVKVLRYRPERGDLFMEAGVGWRPGVVKTTAFAVDMASPPGRTFQTGQPTIVETLEESPDLRASRVLADHGIVSLANVPILVDGAAWGVIEADSTILRGFTPPTVTFLTACGALCGLVVRRAEAEEAQARAMLEAARLAQDRDLLLREMQHRVKNNFQIILAMIAFQKVKFETDRGRAICDEFGEKIIAMSLAHDQLAPHQRGEMVELRAYLDALISNIVKPLEHVIIELDAETLQVPVDQAVPLGLIVNEAVTNAVKHAFGGDGGTIRVSLRPTGLGEAILTVADNGKGFSKRDGQGSGLRLMDALAVQVCGRVERETSDKGTTICLKFPRPIPVLSSGL